MRGASCLAYQRQFGVEETSRDLAFFAADQLAIWHISESTKYRGVSDALSSTYSHTLNGKDPVVIWVCELLGSDRADTQAGRPILKL